MVFNTSPSRFKASHPKTVQLRASNTSFTSNAAKPIQPSHFHYFGAIVRTTQLVLPSSSFNGVQWLTYFSSVLTAFLSPIMLNPDLFSSIPVNKPSSTLTAFPFLRDSLTVALKSFCTDDDKLYSDRTLKMSLLKIGAMPPFGRLRHNMSITPGEK
jgi:hypothetical protein